MDLNIIKIILVILGTIMGAGFASGKEIYLFFTQYGILGYFGIINAGILTGFIIHKVLKIVNIKDIQTNQEFINTIVNNNKKIYKILLYIINSFLIVSFYVMISGFCSLFKQEFDLSRISITIIGILICYLLYKTLMNKEKGIVKINEILIPILIIIIIIIGIEILLKNINSNNVEIFKNQIVKVDNKSIRTNIIKPIVSSIIYMSYNSIILIPTIIAVSQIVKTRKKEKLIAVISSILIILIASIIHIILILSQEYGKYDLPIIKILEKYGNIYKIIYTIAILAAIYTSAVSAGYGFLENIKEKKEERKYAQAVKTMCITGIVFSNVGFTTLVSTMYPIFGILGIMQIILCYNANKKTNNTSIKKKKYSIAKENKNWYKYM